MAKPRGRQFKLPDELNKSMRTTTFRASYEHLVTPWTGDPDKAARYSVQMIFPKNDPWVKKAKSRVKAIATEAFGPNAIKLLQRGKLHNPFRDGDDEFPDDDTYANSIFINANGAFEGKKPPGIFDQKVRDMRKRMDEGELAEAIYSGCYMQAEIKFYPYDREGGKGVACYLFRVQKRKDGEPLGGGGPASDVFDEVEDYDEEDEAVDLDDDDEPF
jgi:hypothetical protein